MGSKIIRCHYDNPLARHFRIEKTKELVAKKYFQLTSRQDVEAYIKDCDVCLALKAVRYKSYKEL